MTQHRFFPSSLFLSQATLRRLAFKHQTNYTHSHEETTRLTCSGYHDTNEVQHNSAQATLHELHVKELEH
jgi:hypothetical protein